MVAHRTTPSPTSAVSPWVLCGLALSLAGCGEAFVATGGAGGTTESTGSTTASGGAGGQTTSVTGGSGGQGGAPACAPLKADACNECLAKSCASTYCGCAGSSDCVKLLQCIAAGQPNPTQEYLEICAQQHKNSISLAGNLSVCAYDHCGECQTPKVDDCLACEYEMCPSEVNECLSSYECNAYIDCLNKCADGGNPAGCTDTCESDHPDGVPLLNNLVGCAADACQTACF